MQKRMRLAWFLLIAVWFIALDRISKVWAEGNLQMGQSAYDMGPVRLTLVHNMGAAFGMGQGQGIIFVVIAVVIVVAIVAWMLMGKSENKLELFSLSLIAAGGIGNMIDRLTTGYVVDFIQFTFVNFPVFNVADMCVTCGVVLLIITLFSGVRSDQQQIFKELEAKSAAERARKKAEEEAARLAEERARAAAAQEDDAEWGDDEEWERAERAKLEGTLDDTPGNTGYVGTEANSQVKKATDDDEPAWDVEAWDAAQRARKAMGEDGEAGEVPLDADAWHAAQDAREAMGQPDKPGDTGYIGTPKS